MKSIIITGASSGIGLATAREFAKQGYNVALAARNTSKLEEVERELAQAYSSKGQRFISIPTDVCKEEDCRNLIEKTVEAFGGIDVLVNNAGIIKRIPMVEMTKQQWDQVINVDLTGPFLCAKAVLPGMIKKGYGKIINACSMMSELGRETVAAYAAAKGGLKMLTKNICSEYGQYNIQCNAIGPGYIATPQTAPLRAKQADGSMAPFDRFIRSKTPAQRWGETEDLEGLAVFLASPASDFINGQVVYIDGGILAYIGQDPSQLDESKFQDVTGVEDIKVADH